MSTKGTKKTQGEGQEVAQHAAAPETSTDNAQAINGQEQSVASSETSADNVDVDAQATQEDKQDKATTQEATESKRAIEIMDKFKVDTVFETEDGQFFLSKNLALLHVSQKHDLVTTHNRKSND